MKNIFFLFSLLLLISTASFAQKLGIKAGWNFTNVLGKDGAGDKIKGHKFVSGYHVGLFGEIDVAETVSIQAEGVYSTKGFKDRSTSTLGSTTSEMDVLYTFSYLDVPLLINIHFGEMASYIGLGPQVSFLMGAKYNGSMTNTINVTTPPITTGYTFSGNDKTGYAKTDFGAVIGTGSKWDSGIEYCLRAGYGLANVIDPSASTSNDLWHNLAFSISLGYSFGGASGGGGGGDRYGHKYKKKRR